MAMSIEQLETDPHTLIRGLRMNGPVAWMDALGGWLVIGRSQVEHVLKKSALFTVDDPRFSTAQVVGPSMLSLDGKDHVRHRDPFARQFRPSQTSAELTAAIEREAESLVAAIRGRGRAEVRSTVAGPLAVVTMAELLGLGETDAALVREWYDGIVAAVSDITAGHAPDARGAEAFAALRAHVEGAIASADRPAVITDAARRLSPDEVVSNAAVLLFGGIDTTEGMIANAVLHLLQHPDALAEVRADAAVLDRAIEESVRLEPAAAVVDRYATEDVELGGVTIGKGDFVVVSLAGANRDPEVFDDPDRFDLHRRNVDKHLSFAHGPHFCIGAHLARMETRAALRSMLDHLPGLRLDERHDPAPRGLIFRKPPELHVRWDMG